MRSIFGIFFIFIAFCTFSQNIKNKYSYRFNDENSLYFIYPQKGFESKAQKDKNFEYDITYLSNQDSLTYNFTFFNQKALPLDSVAFCSNGIKSSIPFTMLFLQPQKNNWKYRISLKMPNEYLKSLYQVPSAYEIYLFSAGNQFKYEMTQKEWNKQSAIVNKIFEVIKYNK